MTSKNPENNDESAQTKSDGVPANDSASAETTGPGKEIGGRDGPDPTRYGDWEKNGRCIDF